ncbi:30S ribosomal protein S15 [Candidatus Saganbacteria bacterium]|nr:30S ribosomal protein S15 [Candidatus Saganbacteria bacterium]
MALEKSLKSNIIEMNKLHDTDSGSTEVQVALLTQRINQLVEHLKKQKKDHSSRRGLLILVGQRKRLMTYLERTDIKRYESLAQKIKSK